MWHWIKERQIREMERRTGVTLDHLRVMGRSAPGMFGRLLLSMPLMTFRRRVPAEVLHVATLGATLAQDCGECLQIAVNVARQAGIPATTLEAAVRGRTDELGDAQALALRFGERVSTGLDAEAEREALEALYGEGGMVELASAVASAQYFPVLKRGMGLARACRLDAVRYEAA